MPESYRPIGKTTFLSPVPAVMLTCRGTEPGYDRNNLITIAWAGVVNSDPPMVSVSIRPERHSYSQIAQSGVFCLNLIDRPLCRATDYCGVKSGRDVDKFKEMGLTPLEIEGFPVPAVDGAPAFLTCRVDKRVPLGSHEMFIARVEQVFVRDDLFDKDGSLHMGRADLIAYAHGEYYPLKPRPEGFFGYSIAREDVLHRRMPWTAPAAKDGKTNARKTAKPAQRGGRRKA